MVLNCDDFMECSEDLLESFSKHKAKTGKFMTEKDRWNFINKQIKKKLKNSKSAKGVCVCDDDFLCKHRKKYLKKVLEQ